MYMLVSQTLESTIPDILVSTGLLTDICFSPLARPREISTSLLLLKSEIIESSVSVQVSAAIITNVISGHSFKGHSRICHTPLSLQVCVTVESGSACVKE